jgi:hypothetical protein
MDCAELAAATAAWAAVLEAATQVKKETTKGHAEGKEGDPGDVFDVFEVIQRDTASVMLKLMKSNPDSLEQLIRLGVLDKKRVGHAYAFAQDRVFDLEENIDDAKIELRNWKRKFAVEEDKLRAAKRFIDRENPLVHDA